MYMHHIYYMLTFQVLNVIPQTVYPVFLLVTFWNAVWKEDVYAIIITIFLLYVRTTRLDTFVVNSSLYVYSIF